MAVLTSVPLLISSWIIPSRCYFSCLSLSEESGNWSGLWELLERRELCEALESSGSLLGLVPLFVDSSGAFRTGRDKSAWVARVRALVPSPLSSRSGAGLCNSFAARFCAPGWSNSLTLPTPGIDETGCSPRILEMEAGAWRRACS